MTSEAHAAKLKSEEHLQADAARTQQLGRGWDAHVLLSSQTERKEQNRC